MAGAAGQIGGVQAVLAAAVGIAADLLRVPGDTPFLPRDLAERLVVARGGLAWAESRE